MIIITHIVGVRLKVVMEVEAALVCLAVKAEAVDAAGALLAGERRVEMAEMAVPVITVAKAAEVAQAARLLVPAASAAAAVVVVAALTV
jgi:hypothetical protein